MHSIHLRLGLACLCLLLWASAVHAHPHSFVQCAITARFGDDGLAGIGQRWVIDEMTTIQILQLVDENRDFVLSDGDVQRIRETSLGSLRDFDYFTTLYVDGVPREVPDPVEFSAHLEGPKLVYRFFMPLSVPAAGDDAEHDVRVAVYDRSFYSYVSCDAGGVVNPLNDPLFGTGAPARPEDYERFKQATGAGEGPSQADVTFDGPAQRFGAAVRTEPARDLAYFYGQIVPDAVVITFGGD